MNRALVTKIVYTACTFAVTLALWQFLVRYWEIPVIYIPAPTDIVTALERGAHLYADHFLITLNRTLIAFALAFLLGVTFGTLVSEVQFLERTIYPLLVALQSMPRIALAPVIIVWFGFGSASKIVLGTFSAFFPIFLNTIHGLKDIDNEQLTLMRSLGSSGFQVFWKVKLPNALPFLLAGANIGIIFATLAVIVAEFLGSNQGMGYLIVTQSNQMDTAGVFANVFILSITGMVFHYGIHHIRRKLIFWSGGSETSGQQT